jgi:hypothetical protein
VVCSTDSLSDVKFEFDYIVSYDNVKLFKEML